MTAARKWATTPTGSVTALQRGVLSVQVVLWRLLPVLELDQRLAVVAVGGQIMVFVVHALARVRASAHAHARLETRAALLPVNATPLCARISSSYGLRM